MMRDYYGLGLGHMFFPGFGILLQLILFIVFILVILWIVKSGNFSNENPQEILKKRFAKGEITKKEYLELKKELEE